MVAKIINGLFQTMLSMISNLLSLITRPIDALIASAFPSLADAISQCLQFISNAFGSMIWAIGLIPNSLKAILVLILTLEIAKYSYFIGAKVITYSFNLIQKIKFW